MGSPGHAYCVLYDGGRPRPNRKPRATCWSLPASSFSVSYLRRARVSPASYFRVRGFPCLTRAGLAAATARGRKGGRKPVMVADKLQRARVMVAQGLTIREAVARLKVGKTALYEALRGQGAQR